MDKKLAAAIDKAQPITLEDIRDAFEAQLNHIMERPVYTKETSNNELSYTVGKRLDNLYVNRYLALLDEENSKPGETPKYNRVSVGNTNPGDINIFELLLRIRT